MIGVDHRGVAKKISSLIPDYMVMGERAARSCPSKKSKLQVRKPTGHSGH